MSKIGENLVVSSVNCRGIRDKTKSIDVINYLNKFNSNIYCLQDTHLLNCDIRQITQIWKGTAILHGSSTNSRGVAFLIKNNFEYEIVETIKDNIGNLIVIDMTISKEFTLRIINIYAPNDDTPAFFEQLNNYMLNRNTDYALITGDYNITLDPKLDSQNYTTLNNQRA